MDVVEELIGMIENVKSIGEFRKTQRKECQSLVRRLKLLLPFLEEFRDLDKPIREAALECLNKLKKAFISAKKLLTTCHCGSKIYLVGNSLDMLSSLISRISDFVRAFLSMLISCF